MDVDGVRMEIHWYEHHGIGRVEAKPKIDYWGGD